MAWFWMRWNSPAPSYAGTFVLENELDAGHMKREVRLLDSL
jgi:hypothetical protein